MKVWAPGRVNLMGEHTDYSGGLVLPIAIQLGIEITFEPSERLDLRSRGGERYIAAVAEELRQVGRREIGIRGTVEADLPRGAGLGSSGAFEVAVALALCDAAEFELEPLELARACQRAERRAVGVPSGILDQAASLLGCEGCALLLDCGSLAHRWIPFPDDVAILVLDSGERHSLEDSGYGDRRRELEAGKPRRVRHVQTENARVRETVSAFERGDVAAPGPLFAAALDAGGFAARMTGGGFGGSVVALAEPQRADDVLARAGVQGWRVRAADGAIRRRTGSPRGPA